MRDKMLHKCVSKAFERKREDMMTESFNYRTEVLGLIIGISHAGLKVIISYRIIGDDFGRYSSSLSVPGSSSAHLDQYAWLSSSRLTTRAY